MSADLTLDLSVAFGNQIRYKCARCTVLIKPLPYIECHRCGACYSLQIDGTFLEVTKPRPQP